MGSLTRWSLHGREPAKAPGSPAGQQCCVWNAAYPPSSELLVPFGQAPGETSVPPNTQH